ncbi:MAG: penicillin acylase family protein [Melioribacteraceae bacterium]|nr:penicillin acylase family protein [Melioribacteraceae bacterium]
MVDALMYLEENISKDLSLWQWGELHKVEFKHFFSGFNSVVDKIVNIGPYKIGGDGTTVFNTEFSFVDPYFNVLGPSMRFLFDFDKPDEYHFILPTGQSGHILSDHYSNMTQRWLNGEYITIKTNLDSIENSNYSLTLIKNSK